MHKVLLIGDSSSVEKTVAAASLSEYLGWPSVQLDQYLHNTGDPELQLFPDGVENWDLPSNELCQRLITISKQAIAPVESLIAGLKNNDDAAIIEGEAIHPRLAESAVKTKGMASIFIIETNPHRLYKTLANRSFRFLNLSKAQRKTVVETDRLYGLWLKAEAKQRNVPLVLSQPWDSLCDRILKKCGLWQQGT